MKWIAALAFAGLAACADWPDTGAAPISRGDQPWPALLPVSEIIAASPDGAATAEDANRLAARAAALRARAALLRTDIATQSEMDALRSRLAR